MALFKGDTLIAGTNPSGGGGAGGGHVIQDSTGEEFEQRPALQFIGANVVDNETDEATQVITPSFREIQGDIPDTNLVCLDGIPIGGIIPYGAPINTLSQDWLPCLGQAVSRTFYHELFAKYGTIYGSGDGSTTFNLPNYGGRVPVGLAKNDTDFDTLGETLGEKEHTLTENEIPAHTHGSKSLVGTWANWGEGSGQVSSTTNGYKVTGIVSAVGDNNQYGWGTATGRDQDNTSLKIDATHEHTSFGGGASHNNIQPSIVANYIVKAKTSSHTITTSNVMTVHNESDENTYSTNYINSKLDGKLLWVNPNPTNNFGAQTISVDFSNCDMYELVYYQSTTRTNRELSSGRIRVGKGSIATYGSGQIRAWDGSNTSLTFENASDNQYLIPAYVIGYKMNLF